MEKYFKQKIQDSYIFFSYILFIAFIKNVHSINKSKMNKRYSSKLPKTTFLHEEMFYCSVRAARSADVFMQLAIVSI